jgi:hypothetical protein
MINYEKLLDRDDDGMDSTDWDEWIKLTDRQQDAICERHERAYFRWLDSLTPDQRYRYDRKRGVENCIRWRKLCISSGLTGEYWTSLLRERQMRLLKLRIWRATGTYPGTA